MLARCTRAGGEAGEELILASFSREGLTPHRWSSGPADVYARHQHPYEKLLFCLDGSIEFKLTATGETSELKPGDRLEIDAGTEHSAIVGPHGCTCIEAARP